MHDRSASSSGNRLFSANERRVLSLAARGLVSSEIAEALGWPLDLVRSTTASAIASAGASSKLETVIIANRRGELVDAF